MLRETCTPTSLVQDTLIVLEDQYIANLDENDLELRLLSQRGTMNARRPVNLTEAVSAAYTCITKGFLADTCDPPNGCYTTLTTTRPLPSSCILMRRRRQPATLVVAQPPVWDALATSPIRGDTSERLGKTIVRAKPCSSAFIPWDVPDLPLQKRAPSEALRLRTWVRGRTRRSIRLSL